MTSHRKPRFVVVATCTIAGSSLDGTECKLWTGASHASAQRATVRLQDVYGSCYRDWRINEVA